MSDLKTLYKFLRERNIIKKPNPLYEEIKPISREAENASEPDNPAQTDEVKNQNRQEFLSWRESLPDRDKADFVAIFGE